MFKSILPKMLNKKVQSGKLADKSNPHDPIQLQVFVGEPHHFTIHSHYPLIKSDMDGKFTLNDSECYLKIEGDTIEMKLRLIKD